MRQDRWTISGSQRRGWRPLRRRHELDRALRQPAPPSLSSAARRLWTIPAGWDLLASDRPVASRTRRHSVNTSLGYHLAAVSINSLGLNNTQGPRPMGYSHHNRDSPPLLCRLRLPARKEKMAGAAGARTGITQM